MTNKCLQCSAKYHCCKNGFAFVGLDDAKRIKETTGKEYDEFLDYSPLSQSVLNLLNKGDPVLENSLRATLVDKENKLLRLKQNGRECIFLKNGECSIYENRPKICKLYPYWCVRLLDNTLKVIDHDHSVCLVRNSQVLTETDETKMKVIFREILDEAQDYKENIGKFVKENKL